MIETKVTSLKQNIVDCSYGANKEGYWNFHHAAIQLKDVVDCLVVLFPEIDFVFLFNQSSGHRKHQKDGLSVNHMKRGWGGACPIMHPTLIAKPACLGPYPKTLVVGDTQAITFGEADNGPLISQKPNSKKKA